MSQTNDNNFNYRLFFGSTFNIHDSRGDIIVAPNRGRRTVRALLAGSTLAETNVEIVGVNSQFQLNDAASV